MSTPFKSLAELAEKIAGTKSHLQMIAISADFLQTLEADEVEPAVSMILGRPFSKWSQKKLDVSWSILSSVLKRVTGTDQSSFGETFSETGDIGSAAMTVYEQNKMKRQVMLFERPLTILEVRRNFDAVAGAEGSGSREKKERLITLLLSQASPLEAKYLVKIIIGEMRTGFHEGLMEQAVAQAFEISLPTIRKAGMVYGDMGEVAAVAKVKGEKGIENVVFQVFRPVKLMLAQATDSISEALDQHGGETAFEYKYDGARVQIHKLKNEVRIFSRRLTDVTVSLPEVVDSVSRNIKADEAIFEGELVAVDKSGVPIPFQHLMRRFKRIRGLEVAAEEIPLTLYLFDLLYLDGESCVTLPYWKRRELLIQIAGSVSISLQKITNDLNIAERFLKAALDSGHEGLMAKELGSPYTPGTRGKFWLKIKPILEPLDLVITAAEWGCGRRHNWLSDYYLASRDAETGEFLDLGKTFKGLTDVEMEEITKRLKPSILREEGNRVIVLPSIVVQVAYNEIQKSSKYESGVALRFARIMRIRDDKSVEDVDTIQRVREIYEQQFTKKGRYKTG